MEETARKKFEELSGVSVQCSGLIVRPDQPWLACSPDGVFSNKKGKIVLLEIKCPSSCESDIINVDYIRHGALMKSHQIYTQVQLQLYCSKTDLCVLFVYSSQDYQMIPVQKDIDFL